ncbi:MAG: hypothetical protein ACQGQP_09645, partial [Desulfovibrio sp.]
RRTGFAGMTVAVPAVDLAFRAPGALTLRWFAMILEKTAAAFRAALGVLPLHRLVFLENA